MTRRLFNLASKYARWAFWSVVYLFRRDPHTLDFHLTKVTRLQKPWFKWRPNVFRNDAGSEWEVWLENEGAYTRRCCIPDCEVAIDHETGRVVGVTLFDEILLDGEKLPDWFGPNRDLVRTA